MQAVIKKSKSALESFLAAVPAEKRG